MTGFPGMSVFFVQVLGIPASDVTVVPHCEPQNMDQAAEKNNLSCLPH